MFCFTFVSDHNIDSLMLYLVRLENMYSYQILYVISPVNNRIVTNYHYTNSSSSFFYFILQIFTLSINIMFSLILSDANDPQGLVRR